MSDAWTDYDTVYEGFTHPSRGGILSVRQRHDPRTPVARHIRDAEAILWQLHWAVRDLVSARSWGQEQAQEAARLRDRLSEVYGLLTDDQRATMYARDLFRRSGVQK